MTKKNKQKNINKPFQNDRILPPTLSASLVLCLQTDWRDLQDLCCAGSV